MRVVLTGGTGLIGLALAARLAGDGHEVILLSRSPGNAVNLPDGLSAVYWDAVTTEGWGDLVDGAGAVVNLAGESIGGSGLMDVRWTPARRRRIYESRIQAGRAVMEAIKAAENKPGVLLQASAIGYYGTAAGDEALTEKAAAGDDYVASICLDWEAVNTPVEKMGVRRVVIRTGLVLSTKGGALPRMMLPFRFFAGGPVGSGQQWYSWISLADQVSAMHFLLSNNSAAGVFNLTAPNPVRNAEFSQALGAAMNRPSWLPVPAAALKLAFGDAALLLLEGQRVVPARLQEAGFTFAHAEIEPALRDIVADRQ